MGLGSFLEVGKEKLSLLLTIDSNFQMDIPSRLESLWKSFSNEQKLREVSATAFQLPFLLGTQKNIATVAQQEHMYIYIYL